MTRKNLYTICYVSIVTMMTASFVILLSTINYNKGLNRENQAFNIFQTCALSSTEMTDTHIDDCYRYAERLTGLDIKRFDK